MINDSDELDLLIDRALQSYLSEPPPLGIEQRTLRHVCAVRRRLWRFGIPAAALLSGAAALLLFSLRLPVLPVPPPPHYQPAILTLPETRIADVRPRRRLARRKTPVREPLTEGERALLQFVRNYPAQANRVLEEVVLARDRSTTIEPLKIEPLNQEMNP